MRLPSLTLVAMLSCTPGGHELIVELTTDLTPGGDFARVVLRERGGVELLREDVARSAGEDWARTPHRLDTLPLDEGEYVLELELQSAGGTTLLGSRARVQVSGRTGVSFILFRDCLGVSCPESLCLEGACAPAGCLTGSEPVCPAPSCAEDADCPPAPPAACELESLCRETRCLTAPAPDACAAGDYCEPSSGCVPIDGILDGGADGGIDGGFDAGPMDECSILFGVTCDLFESGYLLADGANTLEEFGTSVALAGDVLVVGNPQDDGVGSVDTDRGSVNVFVRSGRGWVHETTLVAPVRGPGDRFGESVALGYDGSEHILAVGAPREDSSFQGIDDDAGSNTAENDDGLRDSGAVYVFTRSAAGAWSYDAFLKAENSGSDDRFGAAVSVYSGWVVVGAPFEDSRGADSLALDTITDAGAVYVFQRRTGVWTNERVLKAPVTHAADLFGSALDYHSRWLAIGAPGESSQSTGISLVAAADEDATQAGAVYLFAHGDTTGAWGFTYYVKPPNTGARDQFGTSVAVHHLPELDPDQLLLVVGAPREDGTAPGLGGGDDDLGSNTGAVYVLRQVGGTWSNEALIRGGSPHDAQHFGDALAYADGLLAVGSPREASAGVGLDSAETGAGGTDSGAVTLFRYDGAGWSRLAFLKGPTSDPGDTYGSSVALEGGNLAVGALGLDSGRADDPANDLLPEAGAVFVYRVAP